MPCIHLLEDRERVVVLLGRDGLPKHAEDLVCVRLCAWPEPHRDSGEIAKAPDGPLGKCLAPECRDEIGEVRQIPLRLRIEPPLDRIVGECRNERRNRPGPVALLNQRDSRGAHSLMLMVPMASPEPPEASLALGWEYRYGDSNPGFRTENPAS